MISKLAEPGLIRSIERYLMEKEAGSGGKKVSGNDVG